MSTRQKKPNMPIRNDYLIAHDRGHWPYTANDPDLDTFCFNAKRRFRLSRLIVKTLDAYNARWDKGDWNACDILHEMLKRLAKERLSV